MERSYAFLGVYIHIKSCLKTVMFEPHIRPVQYDRTGRRLPPPLGFGAPDQAGYYRPLFYSKTYADFRRAFPERYRRDSSHIPGMAGSKRKRSESSQSGRRMKRGDKMWTVENMDAAFNSAMAARAAAQATAAARQVSRSLEKKGVDVPLDISPILSTFTTNDLILLNGLVPGTESRQRDGRKVLVKSVAIKGLVIGKSVGVNATDDFYGNVVRVSVVWDKQPGGVMPTWNQIFQNLPVSGAVTQDLYASREFSGMKRFQVLRDKMIILNPAHAGQAALSTSETMLEYSEYVKIGRETVYNAGTAGTIADIASGALYLCVRALRNTAGTNTAAFDGQARVRYVDG